MKAQMYSLDGKAGKEVELPTATVQRVSWAESTVFTSLASESVAQSPAHLAA